MRVILAALSVIGGMYAVVAFASSVFGDHIDPTIGGIGMGLVTLLLCVVAAVLFNYERHPTVTEGEVEAHLRELESSGMLTSTDFKAVRAFEVEEWEDEGPHYFLELVDGSVLYVSGQELWEYEAADFEVPPQPRRFPCTEFTIRRHREEGYLIDLTCGGDVLEPEATTPPFTKKDYDQNLVPWDGDILTGETYDEIKQRLLHPRH